MRRLSALAITIWLAWLVLVRLGDQTASGTALGLGVALVSASIVGRVRIRNGAAGRSVVVVPLNRPRTNPSDVAASPATTATARPRPDSRPRSVSPRPFRTAAGSTRVA